MRTLLFLLTAASAEAAVSTDACALLSPTAIHKVFGEEVANQKATIQTTGQVQSAQCFYTLHTFTNSVSLTLTAPLPGHRRDAARELWRRWFDKDGDKDRNKPESEEEEAAAKAVPIPGVGDDAFWVHSFVGNLYVRKGDRFLRISLGGKMTDEERQVKAKALAADAIRHLK